MDDSKLGSCLWWSIEWKRYSSKFIQSEFKGLNHAVPPQGVHRRNLLLLILWNKTFFCSIEQISTYLLTAIHMDYMSNCGCHYCSYTPISPPDSKGYFDLTIKVRDCLSENVYFQFHQSRGMRSGIYGSSKTSHMLHWAVLPICDGIGGLWCTISQTSQT